MGLDMYLDRVHKDAAGYEEYTEADMGRLKSENPILYFTVLPHIEKCEEVGYWRKANAIHNWFVTNVQNGVDDCGKYSVSKDMLESLRDTAQKVLDSCVLTDGDINVGSHIVNGQVERIIQRGKVVADPTVAEELLPTISGFLFGCEDYTESYVNDLSDTIDITSAILSETDFENYDVYYKSSW